ncbi:hypothetical protein E0Z10_g5412 [Xylaria hypoxylon]|uniref:Heterokaryon incompatibility domain-containing protein n=1 Tax=Xylaria hypoxylon TaxID=37992 RepID=A0A4Z0YVY4_9PEZI|nr:hypothetical protein E0Z10_g5412 [Xylaria hypoxylon]
MYLLNVHTRQLQEFIADEMPPFAILSHTWGEDEVLYQDLQDPKHKEKLGYAKIEGCCRQAIRDKIEFVWVDTCCIDKRSSAELSEAINSMFRWYGEAQVCYVYLIDVPPGGDPYEPRSAFSNSRWFTRGWTLQELIAPVELEFLDTAWTGIFRINKETDSWVPADLIEQITGIKSWYSYWMRNVDTELKDVPVATKLSWVSERYTTRVEDMVYCLLGLLDVNMPLLYGEGHRAFLRLQEEFLKKHFDPTILLWGFGMDREDIAKIGASFRPNCLAPTPRLFRGFRGACPEKGEFPWAGTSRLIWTATPYGLHVELPVLRIDARSDVYICVTNYTMPGIKGTKHLAIPLQRYQGSDVYRYAPKCGPLLLRMTNRWLKLNKAKWKKIYLDIDVRYYEYGDGKFNLDFLPLRLRLALRNTIFVDMYLLFQNGFTLDSVYPPAAVSFHGRVYYMNETVFTFVRERRDTLYLRVAHPDVMNHRGPKSQICLSSYGERRPAIEIWDARRKLLDRSFCDPSRLNWKEMAVIDVEHRSEHISLEFEPWQPSYPSTRAYMVRAKVEI